MEECVHLSRSDSKGEAAEEGNDEGNKDKKSKWRKGAGEFERRADNTRTGGEPHRTAMQQIELKFLYLNARSFMNKLDDLAVVVEAFFLTQFLCQAMYQENPEGTQVIVGSMNMGYITDTARNRTHDLFRPKREPIPLGHSDGLEACRPDVIGIAETWTTAEVLDSELNFYGYVMFREDSRVATLMTEQNSRTFPGLSRTLKLKIPGPRMLWLNLKRLFFNEVVTEEKFKAKPILTKT